MSLASVAVDGDPRATDLQARRISARGEEGDPPIRVNLRSSAVVLCVYVVEFVFYDCPDLAWTGSSGKK